MNMLYDTKCEPVHDPVAASLSLFISLGLVVSYFPQHYRIISQRSSEGISPWFLLLGSTSSAAGMLNMVTLQWGVIKCCSKVGATSCLESLGGIIQVSLMWFLFTLILVLYLIYFPSHLKFRYYQVSATPDHIKTCVCDACTRTRVGQTIETTPLWRLSVTLTWVVAIHFAFCFFVTLIIVATPTSLRTVELWATFLGVTSALLAATQYTPQLWHTYRARLVGAISVPMMCMQTPGAVIMCISIAIRPGTNWTSWITYATAGTFQGTLLVMCIAWKLRQHRLEIDDFGRPWQSSLGSGRVDERTSLINTEGVATE